MPWKKATCSPYIAQSASCSAEDHQPRGGTTHSEPGPAHIDHQSRKRSSVLLTSQLGGGIFSIKFPSFKMTLDCVKWT